MAFERGKDGVAVGARGARSCALVALLLLMAAACSRHGKFGSHSVSAFDIKPGDCLLPLKDVHQEISNLQVVACSKPHTQEAYAVVKYDQPGSDNGATYPGEATLGKYAEGACGQRYESYVGVAYQDSSLFFTYLLPSARSWQEGDDRNILCFVTTTGETLQASVKGSKR